MCGGVWNGFLLGKAKKEDVPCKILWKKGWRLVIHFGECAFPLLQHVRGAARVCFTCVSLDRSKSPRCLLLHCWLPGLSGAGDDDPWATSFGDLASFHLERCLGAYHVDSSAFWTPPDHWDAADIALEMSEYPNIWTDGSSEGLLLCRCKVAGAGVYLPASELAFEGSGLGNGRRVWGCSTESVAVLSCLFPGSCRLFSVLNSGELFLPCRRTGLAIWALTTLMPPGA